MKRLFALLLILCGLTSTVWAANEVVFPYGISGSTLYYVDLNATGQAWNTTGTPAYGTFTSTLGDFDITLTEVTGTGVYRGTPPNVNGAHTALVYLQLGGSPASGDPLIAAAPLGVWDGTRFGSDLVDNAIDAGAVASSGAVEIGAEAGGGGGGGPFLNEVPGDAFISKLSTRADGTYTVNKPCRIRPGESVVWAVDCSSVLRNGRFLDAMGVPALNDNAELSVGTTEGTNYGVNRTQAIVRVTASGSATGTGTVEFTITFGSTTTAISLPVEVLSQ